jgi:hypothetical protein
MALIVPRTAMVDDDGSGTTGTIFNNAWKTALYNDIDVAVTPGIQVTALTGAQTIAVTSLTRVLRCNNPTLLTLQALTGGFDGQLITVTASGAGQVDLPDGSGVANGILGGAGVTLSLAPGAASPFNNGRCALMWDIAIGRWKVLHHEQGSWLPYTPVWGNTGTANTLGNGTITGASHLMGRTCKFRVALTWGSTTVAGSGAWTLSYPFTPLAGAGAGAMPFNVLISDASFGFILALGRYFDTNRFVPYAGSGAHGGVSASVPIVWTTGDALYGTGIIEL